MQKLLPFIFCLLVQHSFAQDSCFLKVHFLYGSKPFKAYKETEEKWFGGIMGGYVGIESGRIVNFLPTGKFHWFAKNNNRLSHYAVHAENIFYSILGGDADSVKKHRLYPGYKTTKAKF